jgi:hypothetical protein
MATRSLRFFVLLVMTAAAITFGFGPAVATARECACIQQPDMTAFGFLINPKPDCDRDYAGKADDGHIPGGPPMSGISAR